MKPEQRHGGAGFPTEGPYFLSVRAYIGMRAEWNWRYPLFHASLSRRREAEARHSLPPEGGVIRLPLAVMVKGAY